MIFILFILLTSQHLMNTGIGEENPCVGQSDFENGKTVADFRKGRWLCRCYGLYFSPDDTSNPCYQKLLLKIRKNFTHKDPLKPLKSHPISTSCESPINTLPKIIHLKEIIEIKNESEKNEKNNLISQLNINENLIFLKSPFHGDMSIYMDPKAAAREIKNVVQFLKVHPNLKINIIGVTDTHIDPERDPDDFKKYTLRAKSRGNAASKLFIKYGLPKNRIKNIKGAQPGDFIINTDVGNHEENRYIAIEYLNEKNEILNKLLVNPSHKEE